MGLGGAVVTGLGAILGTGAYVSIGIAAGQWGDAVLLAIPLAGLVALCSGLSSAHLAGRFPVAGGTYEYGYKTLGPYWGFAAGWLFILAKTASAASAALGVALYLGLPAARWLAIVIAMASTALVAGGLRRTTSVNLVLVTATLAGLLAFVWDGLDTGLADVALPFEPDPTAILPAIAFLFVAFTGYGRVATLGEEVVAPKRTIPRAVVVTLGIAVVLYFAVALAGREIFGSNWGATLASGSTLADLVSPRLSTVVAIGAVTAMAGVLLNLVLGLSRVWLAMGRRGDMPRGLARLDQRSQPTSAVWLSGALVAVLCLVGDIATTWSFSAFSVLLYYGITNLSALALDRRRGTAWVGLLSCLFLSMFVGLATWLIGTALLIVGVVWKRQRPA
jgi:APA family basic amino acid/polyamine antiporter